MNNQKELKPIEIRSQRVQAAVNLTEGDRVPFIPTVNNMYALEYGVSIYDAMKDATNLIEPMKMYLRRFDPDLVYSPCFFPVDAMEAAGYTSAKWPGNYYNLPENTPYQYIDCEFLGDDDWDEFLKDPSHFVLTRVLPEKYKAFAGLKNLNLYGLCNQSIYGLAPLAAPPVREALNNMIKASDFVMKNLSENMQINAMMLEMGYPVWGSATTMCPFDDFADNIRGLITSCMDIKTDPELIDEAVNRWADVLIPSAIQNAKMQHAQYLFIPLHCGIDSFMSVDDYNNHYWPTLKRLICAAIDAEITPVCMCEGKYYTRLETLTDVPKGKVVYMFEDTDFKEAKRILGDVACIGGGMPTQQLMNGTARDVVEITKRMLDICAPGGGYIATNSLALDSLDLKLMEAWKDAIWKYGHF